MVIEIVCGQTPTCGFRVDDGYYSRKKHRFAAGVCARCGGPIAFVHQHTNKAVTAHMVMTGDETGQVVATGKEAANAGAS